MAKKITKFMLKDKIKMNSNHSFYLLIFCFYFLINFPILLWNFFDIQKKIYFEEIFLKIKNREIKKQNVSLI